MEKEITVDVAIIGAGTSGISAFKEASKVTKNIVLIDHGPLGTTCARVGCMPSKAFIQAANYFHQRQLFSERGILGADKININIAQLMQYVRKLRDDFTKGIVHYIDSLGDQFINGTAEISEPNVVRVNNKRIISKSIIIATGSQSLIPEDWSAFSSQILTSENFFEQDNFRDKMVIIGAGLIGLELGQALNRFGIEVSMFHSQGSIGHLTDPVVNQYAINLFQQEYALFVDQKAYVEENNGVLFVKSNEKTVETKQILAALGRKANLLNIDFQKFGIETNKAGVPNFDPTTMQIKDSSIFIAGDVNKERQILHEASDEGHIAGYNAVRSRHCFQRRTPLTIIFSDPNIAIVGQSFKSLSADEFIIGEVKFENQGRSRIMSQNKGVLRIYAEPIKGKLLGAEMIAPSAEHLAHLLAWSIQQNMTVFDVLQMPFYHPTIEEGLKTALRELAKKVKNAHQTPFEMTMCDSIAAPNLS